MRPRVLFFGGRDFRDAGSIALALEALPGVLGTREFCVIHGDARGADRLAGMAAAARGLPVVIVPANWDFYKLAAGPVRNTWMLDFCLPTYAVGFPGGAGTANMTAQLKARGVPVWRPLHVDKFVK